MDSSDNLDPSGTTPPFIRCTLATPSARLDLFSYHPGISHLTGAPPVCLYLADTAKAMSDGMIDAGLRSKLDDRDNYTPGWKYNHWELKGVPLRCEFGPRDMEAGHCVVVRRDTGAKETVKLVDLPVRAKEMCEEMQADMLKRATEKRNASVVTCTSWDGFVEALADCKMILTPWCETKESEELVKKKSQEDSDGGAAKTLCIPFIQPPLEPGTKCFITGAPATTWVIWGRSY